MAFNYTPLIEKDGRHLVIVEEDDLQERIARWQFGLVSQFVEGRMPMPYSVFVRVANQIWSRIGASSTVAIIEDEFVIFKISSAKERDWVLADGPWHLGGKRIMMRCWVPGLLYCPGVDKTVEYTIWFMVTP